MRARCGRDVGEMRGDVGEMWARCRRGVGEVKLCCACAVQEGEAPQLLGDIELNPQGFAKLAWQAEQARYISPYLPIARVAGRAGQGEG